MQKTKALITGGTRGIGRATAELLLRDGYAVWVTGTSPSGSGPSESHYLDCDFADSGALARLAEMIKSKGFSVLVNNAVFGKNGPFASYSESDFRKMHQVNVQAPFQLCQAVIPGMCASGFGRIVNISSVFGVVSKTERAVYSSTKSALLGLTRGLAVEFASKNVLINSLAPGFVDTELTRRNLGEQGIAEILKRVPMGRLAQPEEMAQYIRFLVSRENSYMTGQVLVADGGFLSE